MMGALDPTFSATATSFGWWWNHTDFVLVPEYGIALPGFGGALSSLH